MAKETLEARKQIMLAARASRKPRVKGRPRKPRGPQITKPRLLLAIKGSGGKKTLIAKRMGVTYAAIQLALQREGWKDMLVAYQDERESVLDLAEGTVEWAMQKKQRKKIPNVSTQTARWYLEKRGHKRGFQDKKTLALEGGDTPVQVNGMVSIESLNLPLDMRKQLLNKIELCDSDNGNGRKPTVAIQIPLVEENEFTIYPHGTIMVGRIVA